MTMIRLVTKWLQERTDRAHREAQAEQANVYVVRDDRGRVVATR
jgi:hypothetical protein